MRGLFLREHSTKAQLAERKIRLGAPSSRPPKGALELMGQAQTKDGPSEEHNLREVHSLWLKMILAKGLTYKVLAGRTPKAGRMGAPSCRKEYRQHTVGSSAAATVQHCLSGQLGQERASL